MHHFSSVPRLPLLTGLLVFSLGGCTVRGPSPDASWSRSTALRGDVGGTDLGPLTDTRGRRRSLVLAPAGVQSQGGPYAARNDHRRSVTAGFRSPTQLSAQTTTIDLGPGRGGSGSLRRGFALRDGIRTRTIRRSSVETVR